MPDSFSGIDLNLTEADKAFFKRNKLPLPQQPTMVNPQSLKSFFEMAAETVQPDETGKRMFTPAPRKGQNAAGFPTESGGVPMNLRLTKKGQLDKRTAAFNAVADVAIQGLVAPGTTGVNTVNEQGQILQGSFSDVPNRGGKSAMKLAEDIVAQGQQLIIGADGQVQPIEGVKQEKLDEIVSGPAVEISKPKGATAPAANISPSLNRDQNQDLLNNLLGGGKKQEDAPQPTTGGGNETVVPFSEKESSEFDEVTSTAVAATDPATDVQLATAGPDPVVQRQARAPSQIVEARTVDPTTLADIPITLDTILPPPVIIRDVDHKSAQDVEQVEGSPFIAEDDLEDSGIPDANNVVVIPGTSEVSRTAPEVAASLNDGVMFSIQNSLQQFAAGAIRGPSDVVYGLPGLGLVGLESGVEWLTGHKINIGSEFLFERMEASERASRVLTGARVPETFADSWNSELGAAIMLAPLSWTAVGPSTVGIATKSSISTSVVTTDALLGSVSADIAYDLTDPKYKSVLELVARQPSNTKPELSVTDLIGPRTEQEAESTSIWRDLGITPWHVLGAAVFAGTGVGALRAFTDPPPPRVVSPAGAQRNLPPPELLANPNNPISATTGKELMATTQLDQTFVLENQFKRALENVSEADELSTSFGAQLATKTHIGGSNTAEFVIRDGLIRLPGGDIKFPAPDLLDGTFKKLTREQQEAFNFGMMSADILDDLALNQKKPVGINRTDALRAVEVMRADPTLLQLEKMYRETNAGMLEFLQRTGLKSKKEVQKLAIDRSRYMPNIIRDEADTFFGRVKEAIATPVLDKDNSPITIPTIAREPAALIQRDPTKAAHNMVPPMDALKIYVNQVVRFGHENVVRDNFVTTLANSDNPVMRNSVKVLKEGAEAPEGTHVVEFIRDGRKVRAAFEDPLVAHTLQFAPNMARWGLANDIRQMGQLGTTGLLAPAFAPKTMLREAVLGSVQRPPGTVMGPLDKWTQLVTGGRIGVRGDWSAIGSSVFAVGADLSSESLRNMARGIQTHMLSNPNSVFHKFDDMAKNAGLSEGSVSASIADIMTKSYLSSWRGIFDSYGGYNLGMTTDAIERSRTVVNTMRSEFGMRWGEGGIGLWQSYKAIIESMHNSARLAFFGQNFRPGMSESELNKLILQSRNIVSDLSKTGAGPRPSILEKANSPYQEATQGMAQMVAKGASVTRAAKEMTFYVNPIMQGMSRFMQSAISDTSGTMAGLTNAIVVPLTAGMVMSNMLDEEAGIERGEPGSYADYMLNGRPEWLRTSSMYFAVAGLPPEQGIEIPVAPEYGSLVSLIEPSMWHLMGADVPQHGSGQNAAWAALGKVVGLNVPRPIELAFAMSEQDIFTGEGLANFNAFNNRPDPTSMSGNFTGKRNAAATLPIVYERMLVELLGTAGSVMANQLDAVTGAAATGSDPLIALVDQSAHEMTRRLSMFNPIHENNTVFRGDIRNDAWEGLNDLRRLRQGIAAMDRGARTRESTIPGSPHGLPPELADDPANLPLDERQLEPVVNEAYIQLRDNIEELTSPSKKSVMGQLTAQRTAIKKHVKSLTTFNAGNFAALNRNRLAEAQLPDQLTALTENFAALKGTSKRMIELMVGAKFESFKEIQQYRNFLTIMQNRIDEAVVEQIGNVNADIREAYDVPDDFDITKLDPFSPQGPLELKQEQSLQ